PKQRVQHVTLSPDGRRVAMVTEERTVQIWDTATQKELHALSPRDQAYELIFSADGNRLASRAGNGVTIWDAVSGSELMTLQRDATPMSVAFRPDGERIAIGYKDDQVCIWNLSTGKETLLLRGHTGRVDCLTYSADGQYLISAADQGLRM